MKEPEDNKGNKISIVWDKEKYEDFINITDCEDKIIIKIQKVLWDGFSPEVRDSISTRARQMFG